VNTLWKMVAFLALVLILLPSSVPAQDLNLNTYILQSPSLGQAQAVCQKYGMTLVSTIREPGLYLVQASPSVQSEWLTRWTKDDADVQQIEPNKRVGESNRRGSATSPVPATVPATATVTDKKLAALYGSTAWAAYVQQPAFYSTNVYSAATQPGYIGQGIIAVIDTGIDEKNPVLAPVVIPGYDFTRNIAGYASDLADLNQSTAHILHQSTAHILHGFNIFQLNGLSSAILDADTAAALQGTTLPNDFGHGTMVAGLIHLVAPGASIMPLKAFNADGTSNTSDIIRAIYYAADHGANVINMSFGLPAISDALMKAVNYANRKGVVCVASVGNESQAALVYPAAYGNVIGVASVNAQNKPSSFTNSGPDMVTLAAPGDALVTTYPGDHYASVSGTSFSAALVSGAADLLLFQAKNSAKTTISAFQPADIARALRHATACVADDSLGAGCMDMNQALGYIRGMVLPTGYTLAPGNNQQ
jgi:subtilisin family serine protease